MPAASLRLLIATLRHSRNVDIKTIVSLNFGEALGFYLHEKGLIEDPRDVGQAEVERIPATLDDDGNATPSVNRIAYIKRSGEPDWHTVEIDPTPEEFMWELTKTLLRHPGYPEHGTY